MSRHGKIIKAVALTLLLILAGPSCKRILLYDPEGGVFLELHLRQEFEDFLPCDVNISTDGNFRNNAYGLTPEIVRVLMYDPNTHDQVYEDLLPVTGGFIDVAPGVYDVVAYGIGTARTRMYDNTRNRGLLKAYTDKKGNISQHGITGGGQSGDYAIIDQPDQLYGGRISEMSIQVRPQEEGFTVIKMDLEPMVQTYSFRAYNITGLEHVSSVNCFITGQAPDRFLWDQHFTVKPVALNFNLTKDPDTYSLKAVFNTFGKIPEYSAKAYLQVRVQTAGGKIYQWSYDVTDQFDNPDNNCHSIIVTDPVDIPDDAEGDNESAFGPGVNPWEPEIYDIHL